MSVQAGVPTYPEFAGDRGVLGTIVVNLNDVLRGCPHQVRLSHQLALMDASEIFGKPLVITKTGWRRKWSTA